jgi:uncharacterized damage-inducible protein DinB
MLRGWLDYHRATLLWKCEGLSDDQLRTRSVPPSSMSLLGLVRHMAEVERWWFRRVFDQQQLDDIFCTEDNLDGDFDDVDTADVAADLATFRDEVEQARAIEAAAPSLDVTVRHVGQRGERVFSLRWIVTHMVEEYARHNGHADFLREQIDGQTGD